MTGSRQPVGFAVVGLGVGAQHARTLASLPECHLRSLYDYDTQKARGLAAELGAEMVASSYDDLLNDAEVRAIVIASNDDDHFEQVVAALDAGKHVFVEKPLCQTEEQLRLVKRAWDKHAGRLKLSSNLILRAAPLYRWLKDAHASGELGRLYAIDGAYLYGRLHKITHGWRKDVKGYSVMLGGGIHMIDLIVWLVGERPTSVYATGNAIATQGTDFHYNDYVAAVLRFPSGLIARVNANFGCVHPHQHVLRLFGTKATFLYDDAGARWHASRDPTVPFTTLDHAPLPASKGDLLPEFVRVILSDRDWGDHTQAIFDVISICMASDRSLTSKTPVEIQYL